MTYQNLKEYEKAIGIFHHLHHEYPSNYMILANLAKCHLKLNEKEKAKNYAMKALEIFPDCNDALKILKEVNND